MDKKVYLFLAEGFEETEAISVVDILRRGGVKCELVSIYDKKEVKGSHGIEIKADRGISELCFEENATYVLPGGLPGAHHLNECVALKNLLLKANEAQAGVAAICAAPLVLGGLGILKNRKATCYPGFEANMLEAVPTGKGVEVDEHIITGKGPAFAIDFAFQILATTAGEEKAKEVAKGFLYR